MTVGCNHSLPCLALKIRKKKNYYWIKVTKNGESGFLFLFNLPLWANILCHTLGRSEMSFHCDTGIFVNFNKCSFTWRRGIGSVWTYFEYILVLRISQSINATRVFTVVMRVLDTLYLYLIFVNEIVNENHVCRASFLKTFYSASFHFALLNTKSETLKCF
jgi:hypothetical protein